MTDGERIGVRRKDILGRKKLKFALCREEAVLASPFLSHEWSRWTLPYPVDSQSDSWSQRVIAVQNLYALNTKSRDARMVQGGGPVRHRLIVAHLAGRVTD